MKSLGSRIAGFAIGLLLAAALVAGGVTAADITFPAAGGANKKLKDMGDGTWAEVVYSGGAAASGPLPSTVVTGQSRVTTANTAVCLSSAALVNGIAVKALASNTGAALTVGASSVTPAANGTGNGFILLPGEGVAFSVANASSICFNSATVGDGVTFAGN